MSTQKPFSTISFNTEEFLFGVLSELKRKHILSEYAYILHKAEDDEAGDKDHFHVYMLPNKRVDLEELRAKFSEFDPTNPKHPLGTLPFRPSDFSNWYLYALHNPAFLKGKGQSRKFSYLDSDIRCSNDDWLRYEKKSINIEALGGVPIIKRAILRGYSWEDFVSSGAVPIQQIRSWRECWFALYEQFLRNTDGELPAKKTLDESEPVPGLDDRLLDDEWFK